MYSDLQTQYLLWKEKFTQRFKCSYYQFTHVLTESPVMFHSPQNISGASEASSWTTEADGLCIKM